MLFQLKQLVTSKSNDTNQQRDIVAEYRKLCSRLEQERDTQTDLVAKLKVSKPTKVFCLRNTTIYVVVCRCF